MTVEQFINECGAFASCNKERYLYIYNEKAKGKTFKEIADSLNIKPVSVSVMYKRLVSAYKHRNEYADFFGLDGKYTHPLMYAGINPLTFANVAKLYETGDIYNIRNLGEKGRLEIANYMNKAGYKVVYNQEKENTCEVCNLNNYEEDAIRDNILVKNLADANYLDLSLCYDKNEKKYFLRATADDYAYYPVKYCPDCGRKLN